MMGVVSLGVILFCFKEGPSLDQREFQNATKAVKILSVETDEKGETKIKVEPLGGVPKTITVGQLRMPTKVDLTETPLPVRSTPDVKVGAIGHIIVPPPGSNEQDLVFEAFK